MITYESVPQLAPPKYIHGPRYFKGKPCKRCGGLTRYIATGQCVLCQRRMANTRVEKYIPCDLDRKVAIELFKEGATLRKIKSVLGCSANHVREYLGLPPKEKVNKIRTYVLDRRKELQANASM